MEGTQRTSKLGASAQNPYLIFLPALLIWVLVVLVFSSDVFFGDEPRYLTFARNLLQGFYSPAAPDIDLWSGPGYSIFLLPFVAVNAPLIVMKLANTIFLYLAMVFFYRTLCFYMGKGKAIWATYLLGLVILYYGREVYRIYTEPISIFLICAFMFSFSKVLRNPEASVKDCLLPGFIFGYIALTKVIFGYVILGSIILSIGFHVINRKHKTLKSIYVSVLALAFAMPYLIYTYNLTGKMYYWSNSGGDAFYWMSTPYKNESGSWQNYTWNVPRITENHKEFIESISGLVGVERDAAFKAGAIENIKAHPTKYFSNWLSNLQRMLFGFPRSHKYQSLELRFVPGMFIAVFAILFLVPTLTLFRRIPFEVLAILTFASIFLFGTSIVSAAIRQFYIITPVFALWFAYMFANYVKVDFTQKHTEVENPERVHPH